MLSDIITRVKNNDWHLPMWLGLLLAKVPFGIRPIVGKVYSVRRERIKYFDTLSVRQKHSIIYEQVFLIVKYALENIPFYQRFYADAGFSLDMLKSFDDIEKIPIVDKSVLALYSLEDRSNISLPKFLVNTGGSTGNTLSLYVQPNSIGHEWAHLHEIWSNVGYRHDMLKLMFVGRNHVKDIVDYDFARHSIAVDIYKPLPLIASKLKQYLNRYHCYFLHGYPSFLADFATYCSNEDIELLNLLRANLKAAFLCSEYPYPQYREIIESVFGIKTQSFYGHTERCVMAYEEGTPNKFTVLQTYGYAEAIERPDGHYDLIGTSYYNRATPLIRYKTNDIIDNPLKETGILKSFDIYEGRDGQFIFDKQGNKVSLTGLIMGRHHELFEYSNHIQVSQISCGKVAILYVPKNNSMQIDYKSLFDSSNVDVDFVFYQINNPIRTVSGKINLLVPYDSVKAFI